MKWNPSDKMYFTNDRMDRWFRYGFSLFLFLLPFQTVLLLREPFVDGVKWEYGVIGVYFIEILLLFFIVSFLTEAFFFKKYQISLSDQQAGNIKYQISDKILVSFLLWSGLSIFWAGDQVLASYFFVKLLLAVGLFLVVRGMEIDMKKVVFVLLAAGVIQSGIGVAQFLYQYSPASSIFGVSVHEAFQAGSSVLKIDSGRFLRAYGTFPHPNVLGGFLGVILVLCISYCVSSIKYGERIQRVLFQGGLMVILLGLILTFSRSAWLGVGIAILAYSVFCIRYQVWEIQMRFYKMVAVLGLAGVVFGGILHEQIFLRFDTATIEREGSVSERIVSLQDARTLINHHPIVGVGAGNFTTAVMKGDERGLMGEMGDEKIKGGMGRPVWSIQPAHNVFLLIWSELGVIGLSLFFLFLGFQLYQGPTLGGVLRSDLDTRVGLIFGIALLTFIPSFFLDHFLWTSHFGLLFFFLLLGLASRKPLTE